ncbi:hypothetical protein SeMB42_g07274 [Synchytrium endobioticum]|uniref:TRP C-terminal domain-containing protein n=1 Tax=Synchytrium endobioticum TaxID=286115 RepID=A0A507C5K1_9FUNG|nr:hypothetical protein SeMB42_g07274 [Synchytrium endobioticum]
MRQATFTIFLSFIALLSVASATNVGKTDFCGVTTDGGKTVDTSIQPLVTLNYTNVTFDVTTMMLTLLIKGNLTSDIGLTNGLQGSGINPQALVEIKALGITFVSITGPLCDIVTCPMVPGDFSFTFSRAIPADKIPSALISSGGPPIIEFVVNMVWWSDDSVTTAFVNDFAVTGPTNFTLILCNSFRVETANSAYNLGLPLAAAGVAVISGIATTLACTANIAFNTLISRDVTYNPDPVAIILFVQFASRLGQLSIDYPPSYQGFTGKLGWASLAFPWTGIPSYTPATSQMVSTISGIPNEATFTTLKKRDTNQTYLSQYNALTGFEIWALTVGVPTDSLLFGMLGVFVIAVGIILLGIPVFTLLMSRSMVKSESVECSFGALKRISLHFFGIITRVFIVGMIPILSASFRILQTQPSATEVGIAIIAVAVYALWSASSLLAITLMRGKDMESKENNVNVMLGALFTVYSERDWAMVFVDLFYAIGQSIAVGLIGADGFIQCVIFGVTEVVVLFFYVVLRPKHGVWANLVAIFTSLIRCACVGILWTFSTRFPFTNDMKAFLGYAEIALFVIVMAIFLIIAIIGLVRGIVFSISSCGRARKGNRVEPGESRRTAGNKYCKGKVHPGEDDGQGLLHKKKRNSAKPDMSSV